MKKFSEFITKRRWWVLATWLVLAVAIVALSPTLSSVESNDQTNFLPKSYESVKANNIAKRITAYSQNGTDFIVFKNKSGRPLSSADLQSVQSVITAMSAKHLPHVALVSLNAQFLSPDHKVQLGTVIYSGGPNDKATINAVKGVRDSLRSQLVGTDLVANTTGGESIGFDTQDSANRALKIVSIGTLLLVLILPALIFRSPFAGLLPVAAVGVVDVIATALIADAATIF